MKNTTSKIKTALIKNTYFFAVADFETYEKAPNNPVVYSWCLTFSNQLKATKQDLKDFYFNYKINEKWEYKLDKEKEIINCYGTDIDDFINLITSFNYRFKIFFHNGAKFDFRFLIKPFEKLNFNEVKNDVMCWENTIYKKYCKCKKCKEYQQKNNEIIVNKQIKKLELIEMNKRIEKLKNYFDETNKKYNNNKQKRKSFKELWNNINPYEFKLTMDNNHKILFFEIGIDKKIKYKQSKWKNYKIELADSNLLFKGSIELFGKELNKKYPNEKLLKKEIFYKKPKTFKGFKNVEELKKYDNGKEYDYLLQDCYILYKYLIEMEEWLDAGKWESTAASTTMKLWKKHFGEELAEKAKKTGYIKEIQNERKNYKMFQKLNILTNKYYKTKYKDVQMYDLLQKNFLPLEWLDEKYANNSDFTNIRYLNCWYRGGLTLASNLHKNKVINNVLKIDINSSYPSQMSKKVMVPYGRPVFYPQKDYNFIFYEIEVLRDIKNTHGLPWIAETRKNNVFDEDNHLIQTATYNRKIKAGTTLFLTTIDYQAFLKYYNVDEKKDVDVNEMFYFKTKPLNFFFGSFIKKWYKLKEKAKKDNNFPLKVIAKLLLNALYGKFGTKPSRLSRVYFKNYKKLKHQGYLKQETILKTKYYLPLAVVITSLARMELVKAVDKNYHNFLYTDTDCLMLKLPRKMNEKEIKLYLEKNYPNIQLHPSSIGKWDIEQKNCKALVRRAKQYIILTENNKFEYTYATINFPKEITKKNPEPFNFFDFVVGAKAVNQLNSFKYDSGVQLEKVEKWIKPVWSYPANDETTYDFTKEQFLELEKVVGFKNPRGWSNKVYDDMRKSTFKWDLQKNYSLSSLVKMYSQGIKNEKEKAEVKEKIVDFFTDEVFILGGDDNE